MHERNIVAKMWHALRHTFNIVEIRVLHPKIRQSSEVEILRGLPKGSKLSPTLFGIVLFNVFLLHYFWFSPLGCAGDQCWPLHDYGSRLVGQHAISAATFAFWRGAKRSSLQFLWLLAALSSSWRTSGKGLSVVTPCVSSLNSTHLTPFSHERFHERLFAPRSTRLHRTLT